MSYGNERPFCGEFRHDGKLFGITFLANSMQRANELGERIGITVLGEMASSGTLTPDGTLTEFTNFALLWKSAAENLYKAADEVDAYGEPNETLREALAQYRRDVAHIRECER
jgi:hypothetical protein